MGGGVSVAAAIIVGLLSSFVQSLGLTIQRKSHVEEERRPILTQRKPHRRPLWLLGFGIYITSNIFATIFQLDTLPIVILAPLGAVSLIFNTLLARILLGDHFGAKTFAGTGLVAVGCVLIAVFGAVQESEHSLQEILELWSRPAFLAFFNVVLGLTVIVLIGAHISSFHISRQLRRIRLPPDAEESAETRSITPPPSTTPSNYASPHNPPPIPFKPISSLAAFDSATPTISPKPSLKNLRRWSSPTSPLNSHIHLPAEARRPPKLHTVRFAPSPPPVGIAGPEPTAKQQNALLLTGLSFGAASGVLSGMSLVLAKAAVELLVLTIEYFRTGHGENQFKHFQSWLLVGGLLSGALLQLVYLNYSLTFASPALVCPLSFCFFNLASIFDGLVFYDQVSRLRTHQIVLVSVGTAILLFGVWVVSRLTPQGDGGVEVGTWVEEDQIPLAHEGLQAPFGAAYTDEPGVYDQPSDAEEGEAPPHPLNASWQDLRDPLSPRGPWSPTSPGSPSRLRRPRFGTLVPELAPAGAPTGFAIGLGAASPGFMLIPEPSHGKRPGLRVRSKSEGQRGIQDIMQGPLDGSSEPPSAEDLQRTTEALRRDAVGLGISAPTDSPEGALADADEVGREEARSSWWSRLWRGPGRIKLAEDPPPSTSP